jgi:hypothetical protein
MFWKMLEYPPRTEARHWPKQKIDAVSIHHIHSPCSALSPRSLTLLPRSLHNELGWSTTAQGGDIAPCRFCLKTALPAEAHIADVKSTAKETVAHSTETARCTVNTGKREAIVYN